MFPSAIGEVSTRGEEAAFPLGPSTRNEGRHWGENSPRIYDSESRRVIEKGKLVGYACGCLLNIIQTECVLYASIFVVWETYNVSVVRYKTFRGFEGFVFIREASGFWYSSRSFILLWG